MRLIAAMIAGAALAASAQDAPITTFPYTPGLDVNSMDRGADPCGDFYQYSCGGLLRNNPIPADQAKWSVYGKLYQDNQRFLWGILDSLAKQSQGRNATQQKIGDYFAACMDEAAVEKKGAAPLKRYLDRIAAMRDKRALGALLADLHLDTGDDGLFFGFASNQDFAESTQVIAFAAAGGLGLPDRDYYTKDDARSREIRDKYVAHVTRVFQLLGESADAAARDAATVMDIETALAKSRLTRVERRDPYKLFHKMDGMALRALAPSFDWDAYLARAGLSKLDTFNVTEPAFFKALDRELSARSLDDVKTYLRWHVAK